MLAKRIPQFSRCLKNQELYPALILVYGKLLANARILETKKSPPRGEDSIREQK